MLSCRFALTRCAYNDDRKWFIQLVLAIEYLHGQTPQPILHRDIKPDNIFLSHGGERREGKWGERVLMPSRQDGGHTEAKAIELVTPTTHMQANIRLSNVLCLSVCLSVCLSFSHSFSVLGRHCRPRVLILVGDFLKLGDFGSCELCRLILLLTVAPQTHQSLRSEQGVGQLY